MSWKPTNEISIERIIRDGFSLPFWEFYDLFKIDLLESLFPLGKNTQLSKLIN